MNLLDFILTTFLSIGINGSEPDRQTNIFSLFDNRMAPSQGFSQTMNNKEVLGFPNTNFIVQLDKRSSPPSHVTTPKLHPVPKTCADLLSDNLKTEIQSYKSAADFIIAAVLHGPLQGHSYNELAYMTDTIGPRILGSDNLDQAIDYLLTKMKKMGLDHVHGEQVPIPTPIWVRGEEVATLLKPRKKKIAILGLGNTVGTPPGGIEAPVLVVRSFADLEQNATKAAGKIVVFNQPYTGYSATVEYRLKGASKAAKAGAVASLIRSVTPFSINSPQTGGLEYEDNVMRIPAASITVEDAELLGRLQSYGQNLIIKLLMSEATIQPKMSRNTIGEIVGQEHPQKVVVVSGHLDSWDVGQGVLDNGAGSMIAVQALAALRYLKLRPRRTLRTILWTGEEFGHFGSSQYVKDHKAELQNFDAFFESDHGTFKPLGLDFAGSSDKAACIVKEVLNLLKPLNATKFQRKHKVGKGIAQRHGNIPSIGINTKGGKYFWVHHTAGDSMTALNTTEMDLCTAVWAVASYVIADLSVDLPRK